MFNGPIAIVRRRLGRAIQLRAGLAVERALAAHRVEVSAAIVQHEQVAVKRHAAAIAAASTQKQELCQAVDLLRQTHQQDRADDAAAHEAQLGKMIARVAGIEEYMTAIARHISESDEGLRAGEVKSTELAVWIERVSGHVDESIERVLGELDRATERLGRLLNSISVTLTDQQRVQGQLLDRVVSTMHEARPTQ